MKCVININCSFVIHWHDSIIVSKHSARCLGFTSPHPPESPLISVSGITTCSGAEVRVLFPQVLFPHPLHPVQKPALRFQSDTFTLLVTCLKDLHLRSALPEPAPNGSFSFQTSCPIPIPSPHWTKSHFLKMQTESCPFPHAPPSVKARVESRWCGSEFKLSSAGSGGRAWPAAPHCPAAFALLLHAEPSDWRAHFASAGRQKIPGSGGKDRSALPDVRTGGDPGKSSRRLQEERPLLSFVTWVICFYAPLGFSKFLIGFWIVTEFNKYFAMNTLALRL